MAKDVPRIALGTVLLLLLCLVAGRPQVFSDTRAYYALGQEIAGLAAPASHPSPSTQALRGRALPPRAAREQTRLAYTVAASRSPYWSTLFFLAASIGTAWLVAVLQAATASFVVLVALRGLGVERAFVPAVAVLALASSLPVEVMFLMPDLFAGLTILAALVLAAGRARLARWERAALWLVMAAGALFHTSHLLTLGALGALTLAAGLVGHRLRGAGERAGTGTATGAGAAMLSAAAVALLGALAFPVAVERLRHEPIYAPPFVSARLIADGPGRALLAEDCRADAHGPDAWGWCPYLDRPLDDVNVILWARAPAAASFQAADYTARVRIIREQPRFAAAVIARDPGAVAAEVAGNVGHLLLQYGTGEALGDPTRLYADPAFSLFTRIVPGTAGCAARRGGCAARLDLAMLDAVIAATLLAATVAIAGLLAKPAARRRWGRAVAFLAAGLFLNALICGGLSGNAQRYQSRVTWLIPLVAVAMLVERWPAWRRRTRPEADGRALRPFAPFAAR